MLYFNINLDDPEEKKTYISMIKSSTGRMEIIQESIGEGRSDSQNKRYHVMLTLLSEYTGYSKAWFHKRLKAHLVPHVKWHPFAKLSTADMTKQEFGDYLGWIEEFWHELITDPSMLVEHMDCMPIVNKNLKPKKRA